MIQHHNDVVAMRSYEYGGHGAERMYISPKVLRGLLDELSL